LPKLFFAIAEACIKINLRMFLEKSRIVTIRSHTGNFYADLGTIFAKSEANVIPDMYKSESLQKDESGDEQADSS